MPRILSPVRRIQSSKPGGLAMTTPNATANVSTTPVRHRTRRAPTSQLASMASKAPPIAAQFGHLGGQNLTIEWHGPQKLVPYERNARTHSKKQIEQIAASIREFG